MSSKNAPELPKAYEAKAVEEKLYQAWERGEFFKPKKRAGGSSKPFTISLPPPNATAQLHLGSAMMLATEDLMIRYHRLRGDETLWVPGTDHAAIATQNVVEKQIWKDEQKTRHDLGRQELLHRIDTFVEKTRATIRNQMRRMGSSLDWSHERFTLDEGLSRAVRLVFKQMYDDGLIYRGNRIINWCPRCQTTLADDEVEHQETTTTLYTFKYGKNIPIAISTTRPETKVGDTAIAVNPKDERYQKFVGQTFTTPFAETNLTIKIVADREVDQSFGTGALGVTPAHSHVDADIAARNHLPTIQVIGEDGRMTKEAGTFVAGLPVVEARERVVAWLKEQGLITKEENITQNLSVCYRCTTPVEPLPKLQWFVAVNKASKRLGGKTMRQTAKAVVKDGKISIVPDRFDKIYFHWMDNLRDWCISRQIWYGHRVPAWYRGDEMYVGVDAPKGADWKQDEDTLDTWFSSGLWTFSTLLDQKLKLSDLAAWAKRSPYLKKFHPTSVLETGYDIIFFWVARMILMTTYALKQVPFRTVYLHGLVRDKEGRKMSKSLGNGIDPIEMIEKYGTDAVRLSLLIGTTPGNDARLYEEKIAGYRNFVNKLWNISRFILMSTKTTSAKPVAKTLADEWILAEFNTLKYRVTDHIENYRFSAAGEELYEFTWAKLADWYVEAAKVEGGKDAILRGILKELLVLWHPFAPFVSEHIWQLMNGTKATPLIITPWPKFSKPKISPAQKEFTTLQTVVTGVRDLRQELNAKPGVPACLITTRHEKLLKREIKLITALAKAEITVVARGKVTGSKRVVSGVTITIEQATDESTIARRGKEREELERYITSLETRLSNQEFRSRAPAAIVSKEDERLKEAKERLAELSR